MPPIQPMTRNQFEVWKNKPNQTNYWVNEHNRTYRRTNNNGTVHQEIERIPRAFNVKQIPNNLLLSQNVTFNNTGQVWTIFYLPVNNPVRDMNYNFIKKIVNSTGMLHPMYATSTINNTRQKVITNEKNTIINKIFQKGFSYRRFHFDPIKFKLNKDERNSNMLKNLALVENNINSAGNYPVLKISYKAGVNEKKPARGKYLRIGNDANKSRTRRDKYIASYLTSLPEDQLKKISRIVYGILTVTPENLTSIRAATRNGHQVLFTKAPNYTSIRNKALLARKKRLVKKAVGKFRTLRTVNYMDTT